MHITTLLAACFVSGAAAQFGGYYGGYSPVPFGNSGVPRGGSGSEYSFTGARCADINGQCYENDCNGSRDYPYCRTGNWAGCPCGFQCAPTNGPCSTANCFGVPSGRNANDGGGVCSVGSSNVGCSCNIWG